MTSISIVTYKTDEAVLKKAIANCAKSNLVKKIFIVDNSPADNLKTFAEISDSIVYIFNNRNLGYGKAHNIAVRKTIEDGIKYHLVLNPDVCFEPRVIENIYEFMEKNPDVGILMPKILYPDGSIQYLCKLLPAPVDVISRRFVPIKKSVEKRNEAYELRFTKYDKIMEVPYLSGCFMFIRTAVFEKAGLFDERFFLYFEDVDLSRRIHRYYRTVYYPEVFIYHGFEKGSYKNFKLLKHHIVSAIRYFNKWGWFFDKEKERINKETLEKISLNLF